jgi:hypothetical protein
VCFSRLRCQPLHSLIQETIPPRESSGVFVFREESIATVAIGEFFSGLSINSKGEVATIGLRHPWRSTRPNKLLLAFFSLNSGGDRLICREACRHGTRRPPEGFYGTEIEDKKGEARRQNSRFPERNPNNAAIRSKARRENSGAGG